MSSTRASAALLRSSALVRNVVLLALFVLSSTLASAQSPAGDIPAPEEICTSASAFALESDALAARSEALDTQVARWPLTLPILGLAAGVVGFGVLAVMAEGGGYHPPLLWGLAAVPAAGAATALGFIGYRAAQRRPYVSERRRIAQRRGVIDARRELIAHAGCVQPSEMRQLALASLEGIDHQLREINDRAEAVPLALPRTLTIAGGVMTVGFGLATMLSWLRTAIAYGPDHGDAQLLAGLGVGTVAGLTLTMTGIALTVRRNGERRSIMREAQPLREQKRNLELVLQPSASAQHAGLSLNGRF